MICLPAVSCSSSSSFSRGKTGAQQRSVLVRKHNSRHRSKSTTSIRQVRSDALLGVLFRSVGASCVPWRALGSYVLAAFLVLRGGQVLAAVEVNDILFGPPRVVDGDTLVVAGEKIRLFGIDAPESRQSCTDQSGKPYACGETATEALRAKIGSSSIQCQVRAKDLYRRNVSSCTLPGTGDIGDWLVKNGYAVAYRQFSKAYVADEEAAKSSHAGIWQGDFQQPADWRREAKKAKSSDIKQQSSQSKPAIPAEKKGGGGRKALALLPEALRAARGDTRHPECTIKGNISASGDRIYHVPGGRYYDSVKVQPYKGEQMFCSENEAQNSGFRRSRE